MAQPVSEFIDLPDANGLLTIEYQWVGVDQPDAPYIVFLHEGLGSVAHWGSWPHELASELGYRGLVYSRKGYGLSTPRIPEAPLPLNYLHLEATRRLPDLLTALGLDQQPPILFGHSDGATIALLYAAHAALAPLATIAVAPHIYVETQTTAAVQQTGLNYQSGTLRERLAAYHRNVDSAFYPWHNAWTRDDFQQWNIESELKTLHGPLLLVQGDRDEYASLDHIQRIAAHATHSQSVVLPDVGHWPHMERPLGLMQECVGFLNSVLKRRRRST